ncbi:MAG TPA: crossover junction endodeoxyribonuclease RuvC [Bacteroidia bacterium]|jgi:crossover junction endodeoxyribonuclease RuvC|nr:crossover junction endodeoxyribonuclease RuvC [Bacteroidia bacterium]
MGPLNKTDRVILGIDPGTNIMGYGIIHISGVNAKLVHMDVISLSKKDTHTIKLKEIFEQTVRIIKQYKPDEVALEAPFFGKNVQSMLKLGRAQGISMAAALHHNLPVFEYSPRKVKQSITGKGTSSKEQVALMLQRILVIESLPKLLDATDALAVAMCHYFQNKMPSGNQPGKGKPQSNKKYNSWETFVSNNPGKVSGL